MSISMERKKELSQVNQNTPEVLVYSNGGSVVRQLRHYRAIAGETATTRISTTTL